MTRALLVAAAALVALSAPASAQPPQQPPGPPPLPATSQPLDQMSRQELRDAVTLLRGYVNSGAIRSFHPSQGCTSPESRAWDFWVGEWQVTPSRAGADYVIAESTISLVDQGCVIIENWRPYTGANGMSINVFDAVTGHWHQTYVGAGARRTVYEGAFDNGVLYLDMQNPPPMQQGGPPPRMRMNFQPIDANTVRQWGERFHPATNAWVTTFDLTYRRRPGTR